MARRMMAGGCADHDCRAALLETQVAQLQRKIDNLWLALGSQRLIGVAVGLLAQKYGMSTSEAWERLASLSQHTNVKVRDIARALVEAFDGAPRTDDAALLAEVTRRLPGGCWP